MLETVVILNNSQPGVAYKKECNIVLQCSKHEEYISIMSFFCVCLVYHWGDIVKKKKSSKVGRSEKIYKGGYDHIGGFTIRGFEPAHYGA